MRLFKRLHFWIAAFVALTMAVFIYAAWPGKSTFTISPETTYVTEPIDAQGYVDYPTALNQRLSEGVDPKQNAMVLIWQALGPKPEQAFMPPEYYRWLNAPSPPEEGEYFLTSDKFIDEIALPNQMFFFEEEDDDFVGPPREDESKVAWNERFAECAKRPWSSRSEPKVAEWLKRNEKPLALVVEASKRPRYFNPMVSKSQDANSARLIASLLPMIQSCRGLASALSCRAMKRIDERDFDGAWQDLQACHRLGRSISRGATLIEHLIGVAITAIATNGEVRLLSAADHPPERLRQWQAEARQVPPLAPVADKLELGERFSGLDALQSIAAGMPNAERLFAMQHGTNELKGLSTGQPFTRSIDFDPAFRDMNRFYDQMAAACRQPDRPVRKRELAALVADFQQRNVEHEGRSTIGIMAMSKAKRGERIGFVMMDLLAPAIGKLLAAAERTEQMLLNRDVAIALALYRAEHKRYPETLEELAPQYLATVPLDLFAGQPLNYQRIETGYLLYSIGVNERDEAGRWIDDDPKGDDPRVRMPVTEPKKIEREPRRLPVPPGGSRFDDF